MKSILSSGVALAALAQAATYPISGTTVNCRAGPTTDSAIARAFKKDDKVTIVCQTQGPDVNGNSIWDKTTDGCYVSDYFVRTGTSKYVADACGASSATASAMESTAKTAPESESTAVVTPSTSLAVSAPVSVPTGSNSTAVPTGSATSTGAPAISTTPVPARAAGIEMLRGVYLALPLVLLGMA